MPPTTTATAAYLTQAGVRNTFIRLADQGVRGNGHMMMIEKNNAAIAGVIAQWLDKLRLRRNRRGGESRIVFLFPDMAPTGRQSVR